MKRSTQSQGSGESTRSTEVAPDSLLRIARLFAAAATRLGPLDARVSHVLTAFCELIDASSAALTEVFCDPKDKRAYHFIPLCAGGFWSPRQIQISNEQLAGTHGQDLLTAALFQAAWDSPSPAAFRRRDLVDDDSWYGSSTFRNTRVPTSVDDAIYGFCGDPGGRRFGFGVHRARSKGQFSVADRELTLLFLHALPPIIVGLNTHAPGLASLLLKLPPQRRKVMDALVEGLSEKQIAHRLALSTHSVHQHVRLLYRALNVSSRAELLALVLAQPQDQRMESPFNLVAPKLPAKRK